MTALFLQSVDTDAPKTSAITFILAEKRLVTRALRRAQGLSDFCRQSLPRPDLVRERRTAFLPDCSRSWSSGRPTTSRRCRTRSKGWRRRSSGRRVPEETRGRRLEVSLRSVGRSGDLTSRALESAVSFQRLLHYFHDAAKARGEGAELHARIESMRGDVTSLVDHLRSLQTRTAFLLDATLGMISTEQNQIIKLFSVMAVMLMPPTLVASVYGMNFKHMPELEWASGYGWALGLMFVSGLVPFIYFKRKGWL